MWQKATTTISDTAVVSAILGDGLVTVVIASAPDMLCHRKSALRLTITDFTQYCLYRGMMFSCRCRMAIKAKQYCASGSCAGF